MVPTGACAQAAVAIRTARHTPIPLWIADEVSLIASPWQTAMQVKCGPPGTNGRCDATRILTEARPIQVKRPAGLLPAGGCYRDAEHMDALIRAGTPGRLVLLPAI